MYYFRFFNQLRTSHSFRHSDVESDLNHAMYRYPHEITNNWIMNINGFYAACLIELVICFSIEFQTVTGESSCPSQTPQSSPRDDISLSQKIWNLSSLSFDETRANFLYRRDLHRYFLIGSAGKWLIHKSRYTRENEKLVLFTLREIQRVQELMNNPRITRITTMQ